MSSGLKLRAGWAAVDITPDQPVDLAGYAGRVQPSIGVHDPIYCRALALEQGGERLLLLALDLLNLTPEQDRRFRRFLADRAGIDPEAAMIHCVHPHCAPATWPMGSCYGSNEAYTASLPGKLAQAAQSAFGALQDVSLSIGQAVAEGAAYNRRQLLRDGSMPLAYVEDRSQVVRTGPLDERVGVLALRGPQDRLAGLVVHYACHPVTLSGKNRLISADYPGALIDRLAKATGLDAGLIIFFNGACGDVNPMRPGSEWDNVASMGGELADAAQKALASCEPLSGGSLARAATKAEFEFDVPGPQALSHQIKRSEGQLALALESAPQRAAELGLRVEEAKAHLAAAPSTQIHWAQRLLEAKASASLKATTEAEISAFAIGRLKLLAGPFEIFTQVALDGAAAAGEPSWVLSNTNGSHGYLPEDRSYDETAGYELGHSHIWYGNPGPFKRGSDRKLVEVWRRLAARISGVERANDSEPGKD